MTSSCQNWPLKTENNFMTQLWIRVFTSFILHKVDYEDLVMLCGDQEEQTRIDAHLDSWLGSLLTSPSTERTLCPWGHWIYYLFSITLRSQSQGSWVSNMGFLLSPRKVFTNEASTYKLSSLTLNVPFRFSLSVAFDFECGTSPTKLYS